MSEAAAEPKPKLRWYQYRLWTLLLFVTAVAIVCGCYRSIVISRQTHREAYIALQSAGATLYYDRPTEPAWVRSLLGDNYSSSFVEVEFGYDTTPTDADLVHLKKFDRLRQFHQLGWGGRYRRITDAGLEYFADRENLETLVIHGPGITDQGLVHLGRLRKLTTLGLSHNSLKGSGLVHLKELHQLEFLNLDYTDITDDALEHLAGLTNLKWVDLSDTQVTDEGVKKLQQALPNCEIHRYGSFE